MRELSAPVRTWPLRSEGAGAISLLRSCWSEASEKRARAFGDFFREHPVITVVPFIVRIWGKIDKGNTERKAQRAAVQEERERLQAEVVAHESERLRQEEAARAAAKEQELAGAAKYEQRFQEEIARARRDEL
ncbi:hypothetical protein [Mycobacteroides abscessus]|uniref:hypothetical protein n=1 Tax=Mycobacteroides abscessus TaxID=36809 RepID=UPI0013000B89|nr:hypothetical protein [Mycobacteroides abscessus]